MSSINDKFNEFMKKTLENQKNGKGTSVDIKNKEGLGIFLSLMAREGFRYADELLNKLPQETRDIVKTVMLSAAAGTTLGMAIGALVAGEAGVKVGGVVGFAVGIIAGIFAVVVSLTIHPNGGYTIYVDPVPEK